MVLKGSVQPDHVPVNRYQLTVVGLPTIFFTEISGIELELQTVDLPDRTKASGGQTVPQEFTAMNMMHHVVEREALEAWLEEAREPVSPTYKKEALLEHLTLSGAVNGSWNIGGLFILKRKLPDLETSNEGEAAQIEWTFSSDSCDPA